MQKKYFLSNSMWGVSSKSYLMPSFIMPQDNGDNIVYMNLTCYKTATALQNLQLDT